MNDRMPSGRRRTAALACVALALVVDILDLTIVNVAIPSLRVRFGAGEAAVQWLVAGYAGVFAVLLITGGRLGDIVGYRRILVIGLGGFGVASALCGLAPSPTVLVLARLGQAASAAMVVPQITAIVQLLYPPHERVSALSLFGVLGGAAAVAGPIVGGLLIGADLWGLGWRTIFLVNVPVVTATIVASLVLVPRARAEDRPQLDWAGTALVVATLTAALVPLIQGREWGWPWWSLAIAAAAVPLAAATVAHSRRRAMTGRAALLVLPLFREPSFSVGLALVAGFQVVMAGFLFTLTIMMQQGLGFDATRAGVAHVPFALGMALGIGFLARRLLPRLRARVIALGALTAVAGLFLLAGMLSGGVVTGPASLAPGLLLLGFGMGLVAGPLTPIALSQVAGGQAGAASGTLKATQELGGAIGVAAIGSLFFALADTHARGGIVAAFVVTAAVLAGILALAAAGSRMLPRDLAVFAHASDGQRSDAAADAAAAEPSRPDGRDGASAA